MLPVSRCAFNLAFIYLWTANDWYSFRLITRIEMHSSCVSSKFARLYDEILCIHIVIERSVLMLNNLLLVGRSGKYAESNSVINRALIFATTSFYRRIHLFHNLYTRTIHLFSAISTNILYLIHKIIWELIHHQWPKEAAIITVYKWHPVVNN